MKDKTELKSLAASRCSLKDISALKDLGNLQKLYLDGNELSDLTGLPAMADKNNTVLDLAFNNIQDISPIVDGKYYVLTLQGNPITYQAGAFDGLEGTFLALDYDESLHTCGGTKFSKVMMLGCPADQQLALKEAFTSKIFYMNEAELLMELEEQGIVYPYL